MRETGDGSNPPKANGWRLLRNFIKNNDRQNDDIHGLASANAFNLFDIKRANEDSSVSDTIHFFYKLSVHKNLIIPLGSTCTLPKMWCHILGAYLLRQHFNFEFKESRHLNLSIDFLYFVVRYLF